MEKGNGSGELERRHKESGRPRGKMEEKRGRNERYGGSWQKGKLVFLSNLLAVND